MAGIFGGGANSVKTPKYTEINLQTSAQGVAIPIVYGQNRIGTNIIWYGGFKARSEKAGGKGGLLGGGGKTYYYSADVILALCEGPIQNILQVWAGTTITTFSALGFSLFTGTATQTPWSYAVSKYPSQALSYARTAYLAAASYQLGSSPDLPSHNFEIVGFFSGTVAGIPDANFADIIYDYLTNTQYSIGMNPGSINATGLANYKAYCAAQGIFGSPACVNQEQTNQTIKRWAQLTNSWIFWSGNQLQFVPLGDSALTANGYTYTPQLTPVYNLGYDDFVVTQPGMAPVQVDMVDPADGFDRVQVNILDRSNYYNNVPILWGDQASIDELGELQANIISATEICIQSIGQTCAALIGKRCVYVNRTYTFKLSRRFIFMEPGDIYTITDPNIGLNQFQVRITGVKSGTDRLLTVTAENLPQGVGTVAAYTQQAAQAAPAYNMGVSPGNVNPPAIFEPNAAWTGGTAEVWVAASGGPNWGGCQVEISFDGTVYSPIGTIDGGLIQGTLISNLASHADPDTSDILYVDLTESAGVLPSTATQADADALRTMILVDSEVMSYGTVIPGTLNSYAFDLNYLRRGQYGTAPAVHAAGAEFTRIDPNFVLTYGLPAAYVGTTLHFKFVSFNIFGTELQNISTVSSYTYTPIGTAYTIGAPGTPAITAASATQSDGSTILSLTATWTVSAGPLLGNYEIQWSANGGTSWTNDVTVGANSLQSVLSPAVANTNYLARVRALSQNGAAVSAWSTSASTSSGSLGGTAPAPPTSLAAAAAAGAASLSWTGSAGASLYTAYYNTVNSFGSATKFPTQTGGSGLVVSGLSAGTLYYFWVVASNAAGSSGASAVASCTPTGITASAAFVQGTLAAAGTLTVASGLSLFGTLNPTLTGFIGAQQGSVNLGGFVDIDLVAGISGTISGGTLSLSGTSVFELVEGATTLSNITGLVAGNNVSITGASGGLGTINASASGGAGGIIFSGTNYSTAAAGGNIVLSGAAGVLTIAATGTLAGGVVAQNNGTSVGIAGTIDAIGNVTASVAGGVLTLSSAGLGGSGALTLITSVSASGSPSEIDVLSVFSATYDTYLIELVGFQPTANGDNLLLQFGNASGPTWETSANYYWAQSLVGNSSGNSYENSGGSGVTSINIFYGFYATFPNEATFRIKNPNSSSLKKSVYGDACLLMSSGFHTCNFAGALNLTTTYDSFRVLMSAGSVANGTVRVYGIVP